MDISKFPLHPAQFDIYVDQLINTESPHYNLGKYIKLKGPLNKELFHKAVNSSPEKFDVFKMRFDLGNLDPEIHFDEHYERLELQEMDLCDRQEPEQEAYAWMQKQFNTPFIIQTEKLLFEHVLIRISPDEHWFFFRYHHLITDMYGLVIWVNYIAKKYLSLIEGYDLQVDYPSYKNEVLKVAAYRNSGFYASHGTYWKNKIGKKPEPLLKGNFGFTTRPMKKNGKYTLNICQEQRDRIDEVIDVTKSNLHQLTIAALLIYFGKISGQFEIVFGIPVHKRGLGELRKILGMFSGVLPFKGDFKEDVKLKDLIRNIARSRKEDYMHQDYLTADMLRLLKINSSESHLYDVIINYIPLNFELNLGKGVHPEIFSLYSDYEPFPLEFTWSDYGHQQPLELRVNYSCNNFTDKEAALLARRVIFILEQFQSALDKDIGNISILPPDEGQLMQTFNPPPVAYQKDKSIAELFEEQVRLTPDAIALICGDQRLTYNELNKRSNQLANYLINKGVRAETLVPICIERSPEMIIGLMGILKSGGAFVPIDTEYPQERIDHMLEDSKAGIIITGRFDLSKNKIKPVIIDLFKDWSIIKKQPVANLHSTFNPNNLAYVIYTSGSTGKPKGVMISHVSMLNYISVFKSYFSINQEDIVIQQSSISFDTSIEEIYPTLISGGCICLIKDRRDLEEIKQCIEDGQTTILSTSPMIIEWLNKELSSTGNLRYVISGGDVLHPYSIDRIFDKVNIVNSYGPSETTVATTFNKITSIADASLIGKPVSNSYIYILDKQNCILPVGVPGEIHIGGVQLSRGYMNNAELTSEKFIKDRFSTTPDSIIYKTGDIGYWLDDGNIHFIGRKDNQVKIRGYRIELGEVENVLLQNEQIKQIVVIVRHDPKGQKQLVGYVVPIKGKLDRKALRTYLSAKLPQYMIPEIWVELDDLPITESGKIDRNALPEANTGNTLKKLYEGPQNEIEAKLCIIWQNLLKVDKVGIYDNFFELGGDSMIAIYLVSHVKKLGYSLQVKDLFLHQTIETLSKVIITQLPTKKLQKRKLDAYIQEQENETRKNSRSIIHAKTGNSIMPLYIICGGGGTVLKFGRFIELLDPDQSVYVLQEPTGTTDLREFPPDIKNIARRYVNEILAINPDGPYAISGHCIGGIIGFEMAKQMEEMGKKIALLAMFDTILSKEEYKENNKQLTSNARNNKPGIIKVLGTIYFKLHFEIFLLLNHTKHAIQYKTKAIRSIYKKLLLSRTEILEDSELDTYDEQGDTFQSAYNNYDITPYNGNVIVFYAKDHYHFVDNDKNIKYKMFSLSKTVKNQWREYAKSTIFYEIEGEHSSMFDPDYGGKELAIKLQKHINQSISQPSV